MGTVEAVDGNNNIFPEDTIFFQNHFHLIHSINI